MINAWYVMLYTLSDLYVTGLTFDLSTFVLFKCHRVSWKTPVKYMSYTFTQKHKSNCLSGKFRLIAKKNDKKMPY